MGNNASPGEAGLCLGRRGCDSQHLAGDAQGSCMTRHWQNTFEKPPPQMKIPLVRNRSHGLNKSQVSKTPKKDKCLPVAVSNPACPPFPEHTEVYRKGLLESSEMGYLARLVSTFSSSLSPCGPGWGKPALNLLKAQLSTASLCLENGASSSKTSTEALVLFLSKPVSTVHISREPGQRMNVRLHIHQGSGRKYKCGQ